ncbi:MAG: alkaline phosphatase family protein [Ignavibacteria bacterium]|nr:alkaline phosphatase family protein [Ignavibacteria bacterium]
MKKAFLIVFIVASLNLFAQSTPYVILISFDGFRWDYLNRSISPNLEKIRENGVSALSLRPAFPSKTFPNHQSIITGMYIENHGIISNNFFDKSSNHWFKMSDTSAVRNPQWYLGEAFWETAERNGITTASYFWPGSELSLSSRRPTYFMNYVHERPYIERIEGVIEWLKLPMEKRPRFITLYFDDTDTYGHDFGTTSKELNESIERLDNYTGILLKRLEEINLKDSVNIIIVSDHGMTDTPQEKVINIENIISSKEIKFYDDGPFMRIDGPVNLIKEAYTKLKSHEKNFRTYLTEELPGYFHYKKNPMIGSIILIADIGWSLVTNRKSQYNAKANHGYDNNHIDMHGIFIASGPNFKKNYKTGTVWNIDIYPLLCKIFDIIPNPETDGDLERIEFLLK